MPTIVVFRALGRLGDFLCAVPAIRHLRWELPDATIRLVGLAESEPLVRRFRAYVDDLVLFPGYASFPQKRSVPSRPLAHVLGGADVVVQMHDWGGSSNSFCADLKPKALVAYGTVVADGATHVHTSPYPLAEHEVGRCLRLAEEAVRVLGARTGPADDALEFPLTSADVTEADTMLAGLGLSPDSYAVLHLGPASRRCGSPQGFAELGKRLRGEGVHVLITGGSAEYGPGCTLSQAIGEGAIDVSGSLTLGGLAAVIASGRGVLTNDTDILHLSAAVKAPTVVSVDASSPSEWISMQEAARRRAVPIPAGVPGPSPSRIPEGTRLVPPSVREVLQAAASLGLLG